MKASRVILEFIGTLLLLAEVVGFVMIIGYVGSIEQNIFTIAEGTKRILIVGVIMAVIGAVIYLMCREDRD